MSRCKLIKPIPVMGRVLPAGMMIDAPDPYKNKLVSEGKAVWVEDVQAQTNNEGAVKKQQKIFHSPRFNREKRKEKEKRRKDPLTPNEAALGGLKLRAFFLSFCCSTYRDCAR